VIAVPFDKRTLAIACLTYRLADGQAVLRDYLADIGEG